MDSTTVMTNLTMQSVQFQPDNYQWKDLGVSDELIDLHLDWAQLLDFNWTGPAAAGFVKNTSDTSNTTSTMKALLSIPIQALKFGALTINSFVVPGNITSGFKEGVEDTIATLLGMVITAHYHTPI
jgi:hypothetical protein